MSRNCSVCSHRDLAAIEAARAAGEDRRSVARRFGVEEASLRRHERAHGLRTAQTITGGSKTRPAGKGEAGTARIPKLANLAAAEAFAADPSTPPSLRSLESILEALETEASTARSDTARLRALDMLTSLLPPPPPVETTEPTPADARRLCREIFGEAVEPYTPPGGDRG